MECKVSKPMVTPKWKRCLHGLQTSSQKNSENIQFLQPREIPKRSSRDVSVTNNQLNECKSPPVNTYSSSNWGQSIISRSATLISEILLQIYIIKYQWVLCITADLEKCVCVRVQCTYLKKWVLHLQFFQWRKVGDGKLQNSNFPCISTIRQGKLECCHLSCEVQF